LMKKIMKLTTYHDFHDDDKIKKFMLRESVREQRLA
jgi:hypothetical protein